MSKLARDLLETWFAGADGGLSDAASKRWFSRDDAFDAELRERFGGALDLAARGELGAWCITPHGSLAFVILCDQIARIPSSGGVTSLNVSAATAVALAQLSKAAT